MSTRLLRWLVPAFSICCRWKASEASSSSSSLRTYDRPMSTERTSLIDREVRLGEPELPFRDMPELDERAQNMTPEHAPVESPRCCPNGTLACPGSGDWWQLQPSVALCVLGRCSGRSDEARDADSAAWT